MFDVGLKQNIVKQVIVKVPKARPSPYTFKIQCESDTIMIRMNKGLNRGVDYKVRNRAANKEFINTGAHERIIIRISASPGKTPLVLMTNPPNID